jgi:hypothetical protein
MCLQFRREPKAIDCIASFLDWLKLSMSSTSFCCEQVSVPCTQNKGENVAIWSALEYRIKKQRLKEASMHEKFAAVYTFCVICYYK